jgi:hypothetical protein
MESGLERAMESLGFAHRMSPSSVAILDGHGNANSNCEPFNPASC